MIKVIAFDADDTLWVNEPFFREAEEKFAELLEDFMPQHSSLKELYRTEIENLYMYGYGIKGFMLSMIETAMRISDRKIPLIFIDKIIQIGREMLEKPVELLPGVEEVLKELNGDYRIVLATKGDLLDQERKLKKSGLADHFHHIEVMSEKKEADFKKLIRHLDIAADEFLMMGNSLKSDILPVLNLGGFGIHIPFHITWEHETIEHEIIHERFFHVNKISDSVKLIRDLDQ
ncbi:HAD family hydrolase [Algoriphagus sp.]|uniref:HAD family hydrolase n=1 Tax=Algoriphagus sp. TaxID=1872435 RepID=UPI0025DC0B71|nr:HAD family hydrolase [Algoriphagus sp.]